MKVAYDRLIEVEKMMSNGTELPALFSSLQPSARAAKIKKKGMVDVDEVLCQEAQGAI